MLSVPGQVLVQHARVEFVREFAAVVLMDESEAAELASGGIVLVVEFAVVALMVEFAAVVLALGFVAGVLTDEFAAVVLALEFAAGVLTVEVAAVYLVVIPVSKLVVDFVEEDMQIVFVCLDMYFA